MKVILWWKLKKLKLPKKWKRVFGWWRFACGYVSFNDGDDNDDNDGDDDNDLSAEEIG